MYAEDNLGGGPRADRLEMKARTSLARILLLAGGLAGCGGESTPSPPVGSPVPLSPMDWTQWGQNPRHDGQVAIAGQRPARILAELVNDPLVEAKKAESRGALLTHYQVPLVVDDEEVVVALHGGRYSPCAPPGSGTPFPCGPEATSGLLWSERLLRWQGSELVTKWTYDSDWKPVPDFGALGGWEPVFHAVIAGDFVYVPASAGTVDKVNRADGSVAARINPFPDRSASRFVAGPLSTDGRGNVLYNAVDLVVPASPSGPSPWQTDVRGAWLVRVGPDDRPATVPFSALVPGAPGAADPCETSFANAELPWPPSPSARPPSTPCGSPRPGINVAPAVAPDGTIYTIARAHFNPRYGYLVAVNADLSPRWAASLRGRLADGCGTAVMPPTGSPGGCRAGARIGVDPATNDLPAAQVVDRSSSSPTVAPDGAILYGAFTRYNGSRGHLLKFGPGGDFLAAYDFGWDITPAIYTHGGTYSVVIKDNRYGVGSYCGVAAFCPAQREGPFDITQLGANLAPEWRFTHANSLSCRRNPGGGASCVDDHPNGFEWCINAAAVDANGVVYANSEDGGVYSIEQGGTLRQSLFLDSALGAAYTPVALGRDGRIYTQNNGRLFVVGN
jgi:hypothetical protein